MIAIENYLILGLLLFFLSLFGLVHNRANFISLLMCLELMLLSINIQLIAFAQLHQSITGQLFVFFNLTIAAAESAIALGLLICLFRQHTTYMDSDELTHFKG
tara:strand:+ start:186 stop:494 length:309 start_codon:yes stop_codon:yes gene_type:complete